MNIVFAIICYLIVPMSGLCIDLYAPSLPAISSAFGTPEVLAKYTISFYLLSFAFFQLFAGPVTDSFGRKKPIIVSLIIFIIISYLMTLTTSMTVFMVYRILQGVCIAFVGVSARAIIPDIFEGAQYKKMINYMTIIWALGPIIAPFIGGHLQHYFGWKSCFYFFSIYGICVLLLVTFIYRETAKQTHKMSLGKAFSNYYEMATHNHFVLGTLCIGLLYSFLVIFSTVGVFVIEDTLHYSAITFGNIALLMGFAWFLGNMANRFLLHLSEDFNRMKLSLAVSISAISCLILMIISILLPTSIVALAVFMFIAFFFAGIVFPNFFALCIGLFSHIAGSANALMGSFFIFLTSILVFIFGLVHIHTILALASIIFILSLVSFILIKLFFALELKK
ncbi:MFS transporter [Francisella sp. SYW-9]|uniref:MFS transporter n=1 Tax=Francisella sp. SYW-9 TaxID=2610888 RepID=UPI00123E1CC4|nr:MFS transporter [Francisella sp. SYW-9]